MRHQKYEPFFSFNFVRKKPSQTRKPSQAEDQAKTKKTSQAKDQAKQKTKPSHAKNPRLAKNQAKPPTFFGFPGQDKPQQNLKISSKVIFRKHFEKWTKVA
jgi:hypothetical protein